MMKSKLKYKEGRKQIANLYFQKLDDLALAYELNTIETSFGDTNIITIGDNNPPLILVHGFYSCAPFAIETILDLEKYFKIYAIDILGEPNLSEETSGVLKTENYAKWMYEILSRLQIYNAYFIGFSLGGFIGLKSLVLNSTRFKKAFLINPSGIVKFNTIPVLVQILLPSIGFKYTNRERYLKKIQKGIFTEVDLFSHKFLKTILLFCKLKPVTNDLIFRKEANSITTRLYIIASEDGVVFSGKKLLKKTKKMFPSLEEVIFFPKGKHILSAKQHKFIVDYILKTINS